MLDYHQIREGIMPDGTEGPKTPANAGEGAFLVGYIGSPFVGNQCIGPPLTPSECPFPGSIAIEQAGLIKDAERDTCQDKFRFFSSEMTAMQRNQRPLDVDDRESSRKLKWI